MFATVDTCPSSRILFDAAQRIEREAGLGYLADRKSVAGIVRDACADLAGNAGPDSGWLADQIMLWYREAPERARMLTMAALADRAGALRRLGFGRNAGARHQRNRIVHPRQARRGNQPRVIEFE